MCKMVYKNKFLYNLNNLKVKEHYLHSYHIEKTTQ